MASYTTIPTAMWRTTGTSTDRFSGLFLGAGAGGLGCALHLEAADALGRFTVIVQNAVHPGVGGTVMAPVYHLVYEVRGAFEYGFYTSIQPVTHPAAQTQAAGALADPGAKEDALDAAGDEYVRALQCHTFKLKLSVP